MLEAALPAELHFIRGWPPRPPTPDEAVCIAGVRRRLLAQHELDERYPMGALVRDRFGECIDQQLARGTRARETRHG